MMNDDRRTRYKFEADVDPEFVRHQLRRLSLIPAGTLPIARAPLACHDLPFGFAAGHASIREADAGCLTGLAEGDFGPLVLDRGQAPIMTIAPTSAGKGVGVIIPTLLTWHGPSIVIDPKGEAVQVVASQLLRRGIDVVAIDPFGESEPIIVNGSALARGRLNPMQTLIAASPTFEADVLDFANTLVGESQTLGDRFWDNLGLDLIVGCAGHLATFAATEECDLFGLREMLCDPDLDYRIALLLDNEYADRRCFISQAFKTYLGHERDKVRTSVRSTAVQHFTCMAGENLRYALSDTSFDFQAVTDGRPLAIFLTVQPHRLVAAAPILRLLISSLLGRITRRRVAPRVPTLIILDELAQLGSFPLLRPLVTLMRGYGARPLLVLQDASQLRNLYPRDYPTMINNCAVLTTFGHSSYAMSREMADLMGDVSADQLFAMTRDEIAVRIAGKSTRILKRLNYLSDPLFTGLYARNILASGIGE